MPEPPVQQGGTSLPDTVLKQVTLKRKSDLKTDENYDLFVQQDDVQLQYRYDPNACAPASPMVTAHGGSIKGRVDLPGWNDSTKTWGTHLSVTRPIQDPCGLSMASTRARCTSSNGRPSCVTWASARVKRKSETSCCPSSRAPRAEDCGPFHSTARPSPIPPGRPAKYKTPYPKDMMDGTFTVTAQAALRLHGRSRDPHVERNAPYRNRRHVRRPSARTPHAQGRGPRHGDVPPGPRRPAPAGPQRGPLRGADLQQRQHAGRGRVGARVVPQLRGDAAAHAVAAGSGWPTTSTARPTNSTPPTSHLSRVTMAASNPRTAGTSSRPRPASSTSSRPQIRAS